MNAMACNLRLALPDPIAKWLIEQAEQHFVTPTEYARRLLIDLYVNATQELREPVPTPMPSANVEPSRAATPLPTTRPAKSGYKGVYPYGKRWAAVISDGRGGQQRLGVFDTPEQAAQAYDNALVARAGGDPRATVNFVSATEQAATAAEAPFMDKLMTGQQLSDIEWAQLSRVGGTVSIPASHPAAAAASGGAPRGGEVEDRTPLVDAAPKRLRKSVAPTPISSPITSTDPDDEHH
jgi:hypothetical protein